MVSGHHEKSLRGLISVWLSVRVQQRAPIISTNASGVGTNLSAIDSLSKGQSVAGWQMGEPDPGRARRIWGGRGRGRWRAAARPVSGPAPIAVAKVLSRPANSVADASIGSYLAVSPLPWAHDGVDEKPDGLSIWWTPSIRSGERDGSVYER